MIYYDLQDGVSQYNSDIIAIPISYKWQFGKKKLNGYIFGGPYFAIELNAKYENYEPEFNYYKNDFGTFQGLGIQYAPENSKIIIYGDAELYKGTINKAPFEFGDLFMFGLFVNKKLINLNLSVGVKFKI
ncbi:MAG: outer membrane beta-barrel protein [Bacteroidales bacterium]|nr:outer membrane beta-barrel protein [Bacteroidales bacterium]